MSADEKVLEVFRCFCARKPILAFIKADKDDKPFVHVKVYKQDRIFGEFIFTFGELRLRCRECYRWHIIRIISNKTVIENAPAGDVSEEVSE